MLPASASARQVADQVRSDFAVDSTTNVTVVIPDTTGVTPDELGRYAAQLSQVPDVSSVSSPGGTFVDGALAGPPSAPTAIKDGSAFLTVGSTAPLFSPASDDSARPVARRRRSRRPTTSNSPGQRRSAATLPKRSPPGCRWSSAVIAAITFVLLFLLTGSVVLPLKALLLNILSLTAAFGALVWIFQDGHLGAFGTTPTGTLVANMPVLLFCIAFGLSMDYEVFLISRIREYWLDVRATQADNDESVALGLARTGRVVTAAALVMSISFAALIAAQVSLMRMFGVGLTLAVLVDATLVRIMLVPAFMHVLGRANWWAPKPLVRLHERLAISEAKNTAANRGCPDGDRSVCRYPFLTRSSVWISVPDALLVREPRGSASHLAGQICLNHHSSSRPPQSKPADQLGCCPGSPGGAARAVGPGDVRVIKAVELVACHVFNLVVRRPASFRSPAMSQRGPPP